MNDKNEIVVPPVLIADEKNGAHRVHRESKTSVGLSGNVMGSSVSFFVSRDTVTDRDEKNESKSKTWCCWK